ncbi:MAG: hypothetical protein ACXADY_20745 [Candidatus Hodarchaeales archaeon]|jgi:hypothetical protein
MDYEKHYKNDPDLLDRRGLGIHSNAEQKKFYVPKTEKADPIANMLGVPFAVGFNLGNALAQGLLYPLQAFNKKQEAGQVEAGQTPPLPSLPRIVLPDLAGLGGSDSSAPPQIFIPRITGFPYPTVGSSKKDEDDDDRSEKFAIPLEKF